ncbi:MAG: T9SS type A sorting domain-containing protein [Bacteroidetes bacterium]|nr:T9SS type A sorting domain-containing protein [Bacteroidota bacterium]
MQQEFDRTRDPLTGEVPRERLLDALNVIREQQANKRHYKAAISGITWNERGPKNVGGRLRSLLFDANDASGKTAFAASVSGGLWKTTDLFAAQVEWTPVNDLFDNLSICALAQDPSDPDILYFGTGEGYFNVDAVRGNGIWKSTDGGESWSQLSATNSWHFDNVTKLIVDQDGNLVAGTRSRYINYGGVFRSTDGGSSFTNVLERYTASGGTEYDRCADVELSADGKTWYAAMGIFSTDGIYKSIDSAKTWSLIYDADSASEQRIELVCAPSDSNYIYALVQGSSYGIKKIMKSTNAGASWSTCTTISWQDQCSSSSTDFTRDQAWYNLIGVVDPNDASTLVVGGINMFRTTNSGSSWTQLSSWVGCGGYSEVHSDHHVLVYKPGDSDTLINGNDGGIYLTEDVSASPPVWKMTNDDFNVTQFYAGAMHPDAGSHYFLTGAQDNGSQRFMYSGVNYTDEVTGGDGAFCHIDQDQPSIQLTAYTNNNIRISTDGFVTYTSYSSSVGNFINASDYDDDNNILYSGSNANQLYRWSNVGGSLSSSNLTLSNLNGYQVSAVTVSSHDPTSVYVGTEDGRVVKVSNANGSFSDANISTGLPTSVTVSCIAEDPRDADHLLVTYSNYGATSVYETTNQGTSWSSVEGDLPDMPVRWALFSPWGSDSALLATETGVWSTTNLNGGSTSWEASNSGMSNVRTDMLVYRPSDSMVMAVTHGRGVYTTTFFSNRIEALFGSDRTIIYEGDVVDFFDDSYGATSWKWDFNNDGIYESTEQNPSFAFGEGGYYSVTLVINNSDTLTNSDFIQVIPNQGTPYTTSDGGDMESNPWHFGGRIISGGRQLWERGAPSNSFDGSDYNGSYAWVTDLDDDMTDTDMDCELLSPNFNFTASGTYTLSFLKSMEYQFSNGPFAARVEYSTNRGKTWTLLGSDNSGGTGWYNRGPNSAGQLSYQVFGDLTGWTGTYSKSTSSHDVSFLSGNQNVCFRIRFKVSNAFSNGYSRDGFLVDDFAISGPDNDSLTSAGIETEVSSRSFDLGPYDSAHLYSSNGKIMASIWNLSSHDFGETVVQIDAAGTSAQNFDTNTVASRQIFSKTLKITPTTNNGSASVKITTYYSSSELAGWKSATGRFAKDILQVKTTNAVGSSTVAQSVHPDSWSVDSAYNGSDVCISGTYSNGFSGVGAGSGGAGDGNSPLPVSLISFKGIRSASETKLFWTTASEINNDVFEIQRANPNGEFRTIGHVRGMGTSNNLNHYQYTDRDAVLSLPHILCYRLKQVDFDGTFTWSSIICLDPEEGLNVNIGPNPTTDLLRINISDDLRQKEFLVHLVDQHGRVRQEWETSGQFSASLSNLPSGTYFIHISDTSGRSILVRRIVKL